MRANKKPSKRAAAKAALLASAAANVSSETPAPAAPIVADKAADRAARQALTAEAHLFVSALYDGASKPVHRTKPGKLAAYIARIQHPGHACGDAGPSTRDHALLMRIATVADKAGAAFNPCDAAIAADLGVVSRLASVAYIATDGETVTLTEAGAERIRLLRKRAA